MDEGILLVHEKLALLFSLLPYVHCNEIYFAKIVYTGDHNYVGALISFNVSIILHA